MKKLTKEDKARVMGVAYCIIGMMYDDKFSDEQRKRDIIDCVEYNRNNSDKHGRAILVKHAREVINEQSKILGIEPLDNDVKNEPNNRKTNEMPTETTGSSGE